MDDRTKKNSLLAAPTLFTFIGAFGAHILDAVGWIQYAQGLDAVMALFDDARISWPGIYLFGFILSGCLILGANYDLVRAWRRKRVVTQKRSFDIHIYDAINYIAYQTLACSSLPERERLSAATDAVYAAAKGGKLAVYGRLRETALQQPIPKTVWENTRAVVQTIQARYDHRAKLGGYVLSDANDEKKVFYDAILLDSSQVRELWPEDYKTRHV
jgi:hypothetical protein